MDLEEVYHNSQLALALVYELKDEVVKLEYQVQRTEQDILSLTYRLADCMHLIDVANSNYQLREILERAIYEIIKISKPLKTEEAYQEYVKYFKERARINLGDQV